MTKLIVGLRNFTNAPKNTPDNYNMGAGVLGTYVWNSTTPPVHDGTYVWNSTTAPVHDDISACSSNIEGRTQGEGV